jgi:hypothetical protein
MTQQAEARWISHLEHGARLVALVRGQQRAVAGHADAARARSASICANKRGNSTGLA